MKKTGLTALALLCLFLVLLPMAALGEAEAPQYFLRVSYSDDIRIGTRLDPQVYRLNPDGSGTAVYWSDGVRNWKTSDSSVIDFREYHTDEFVAVGYGRATISVTAPDGIVLSRELHVMVPPKTLMISPKAITLHEGETFQLTYDAEGGDGTFRWYCYGDVASVDENGLVTARQHGKTAVAIYSNADDNLVDACSVTVLEDENSLEIRPQSVILGKGDSQQFVVTTHAGVPVEVTFNEIYNTSFTLTRDGLVSATAGEGGGTITAVDALGRKVTATIRCTYKDETLTLAYACPLMIPGESGDIYVNSRHPEYGVYTFTSSNPSVISFLDDQMAMFWCKNAGKARVTVKSNYDGSQATIDLTVKAEEIYLDDDYERVFWGQSFKLIAYDGVTGKPVSATFTSSIPLVASVGKTSGIVTARGIYHDPEEGDIYDRVTIYVKDARGRKAQATIVVIFPPVGIDLTIVEGDPMMRVGDTLTLKADVDIPELSVVFNFNGQFFSSNPSVAKVDKSGKVTAVGVGTAVITASMYNGVSDSLVVTVGTADPEWVRITCGDLVLGRGEQLAMDRYPPEFNQGASSAYAYYSSDRSVLSAGGRWIQAVGVGTATLTIRTFNDVRDSVTVTVKNAPTKINVSSEHMQLAVGDRKNLTISLPEGEAGSFSVTAEGEDCVSFSEVSDDTVRVTGKKTGSLTLMFATYNGVTRNVRIDVLPGPSSVSLPVKTLRLAVGDAYTFTPKFKGNPTSYIFSSTKTSVATVTEDGVVTPVAPGKTTIIVTTGNGKKASCTLTVYQKVTSIDLSANPKTVSLGKTLRLKPLVQPTNAANRSVKWSTADKTIATVNSNGEVTGKRVGSVVITATALDGSGIFGTFEVTVLPLPTGLVLYGDENTDTPLAPAITVYLSEQRSLRLFVRALPAEAEPAVTWTISNKKLATVAADGTITFKGRSGTMTVKATSKLRKKIAAMVRITILPDIPKTLHQTDPDATPAETPAPEETPSADAIPTDGIPSEGAPEDVIPAGVAATEGVPDDTASSEFTPSPEQTPSDPESSVTPGPIPADTQAPSEE